MPKFELQKVGFVNPSTLTENVVLSTILEGAGGATRSFVEEEPESYVLEDNQDIKDGQVFTFTMAGKPTNDLSQLVSWANTNTKLSISGYAYNEALLIDNAYITLLTDPSERRVWKITAQKAGEVGYKDGKLGTEFMISPNLLNMHFFEDGGSGVLAGWTKTGGSASFTSGDQVFTTTGASAVYLQKDIIFPFTKQMTFAITPVAVTSTTGMYIGIQAFDEAGSEIGSESTANVTNTSRTSVSRMMPSGTVKARVRVKIGQNDSIQFNEASFNVGTSTNYVAQ